LPGFVFNDVYLPTGASLLSFSAIGRSVTPKEREVKSNIGDEILILGKYDDMQNE
jgi:hypothetical protein